MAGWRMNCWSRVGRVGFFVVVWMVVFGVLFCVLTVVMGRYVYM